MESIAKTDHRVPVDSASELRPDDRAGQVLIPGGRSATRVLHNGDSVAFKEVLVGDSRYVQFEAEIASGADLTVQLD